MLWLMQKNSNYEEVLHVRMRLHVCTQLRNWCTCGVSGILGFITCMIYDFIMTKNVSNSSQNNEEFLFKCPLIGVGCDPEKHLPYWAN